MRNLRGLRASDVALGVLVLAGIVLVALLEGTPRGAGSDTFASTDYRSGGYAAWYALLQREGIAVERFERRAVELDANIDTLVAAYPVVPAGADARRPADLAALARWVRDGGRLIALGHGGGLGRSGAAPAIRTVARAGGALEGPATATVEQLAGLSRRRFVGRGATNPLAGDRGGAIAVRVPYGRGEVVYVTEPRLFENALLARADNARLAFVLANPRRAGGIVAFDETLHGALVDRRWWDVIGVPQRVALGGVALTVLLALAGSALRLGPPVTLRAAREPASDEFIAAVAALYERSKARRAALAFLAAGAGSASGEAVTRLQLLAERPAPSDRDLIAGAVLARAIREES